jgi:hypothetical protein
MIINNQDPDRLAQLRHQQIMTPAPARRGRGASVPVFDRIGLGDMCHEPARPRDRRRGRACPARSVSVGAAVALEFAGHGFDRHRGERVEEVLGRQPEPPRRHRDPWPELAAAG